QRENQRPRRGRIQRRVRARRAMQQLLRLCHITDSTALDYAPARGLRARVLLLCADAQAPPPPGRAQWGMLARLLDSLGSGTVEIPALLWEGAVAELAFLRRLDTSDRAGLHELCGRLLATKVMTGAGGLELTAPIQVAIAAQACLPILKLGIDWYRGWSGIVVYPSEYVAPRRVQDETGVVHEFDETAAGGAWGAGAGFVSWTQDQGGPAAGDPAFNVVIHEFAHKLDLLNG